MDKKEEREDLVEATDSDRRDFLKSAVAAAGAFAVAAAIGDLVSDEAEAGPKVVGRNPQTGVDVKNLAALKATPVRGAQLQMLKGEGQKSFRLEGAQLGNILKTEGLLGPEMKDISKVASTLSLSY